MKHTNAGGVAVHISSSGLEMMRWKAPSEPSGTQGANRLCTSARATIQHSCSSLAGLVAVNFSGWMGNEESMVKPFNSLHFLMLSGFDPGCCRRETS